MAYAAVLNQEKVENTANDCTICQLPFNDARILQCQHEFCAECIGKWIVNSPLNKSEEKGIDCPICRRVTKPPREGSHPSKWAHQLPQGEGKSTFTDDEKVKCNPCEYTSLSINATVYCSDCQEHLCMECQTSHKKLKMSRNHTLVEIGTGKDASLEIAEMNNLLHCSKHRENEFAFYCHDHEELVCSTCAFIDHRHCDDIVEIENNAALVSQSLSAFMTKANTRSLHAHVTDVVSTQKKYEGLLQQDLTGLPVKLKRFRDIVNERLDTFEANILREGKEMQATLDQAVKQERAKCECIARKLQSHMKIADKLTQLPKSSRRHFVLTRSLKKERELIRSEIYEEGKECLPKEFKEIKFQMNDTFVEQLCHDEKLGELINASREMGNVPELQNEGTTLIDFPITQAKDMRKSMHTKRISQPVKSTYIDQTHIAIADKAKQLHIIGTEDDTGNKLIKLKRQPWDMTFIQKKNMMALSHPTEKKISIYNTNGGYSLVQEIRTRTNCYGIAYLNNNLLTSLCEDLDDWSMCIINLQGTVEREITEDSNGRKFQSFWYFTVDDGNVYQSCSATDQLYKFDLDSGDPHFNYESDELKGLGGVAVDGEKNVYVCGLVSKNIHILNEDGDVLKILNTPGCSTPLQISFSPDGAEFVVEDQKKQSGPYLYRYTLI